MKTKRVFLIVLDSFGIGEEPDAAEFGDEGSDTLGSVSRSPYFCMPVCRRLGLFNIEGISAPEPAANPAGSFARMRERSKGKDTTIGHWEIAGIVSPKALPTYPNGFPREVLERFERETGRGVLCNKPYSGTQVIADYGEEHLKSGKLIVYTSADSVFQIAAHEELVPPEELYRYCRMAREILCGEHAVGRVIARPFTGAPGSFTRTRNRHDFSLQPPGETMLDALSRAGKATIGVGKISDIFAGKGIGESYPTKSNRDGMDRTFALLQEDFEGLCFVNLVDFDMLFGHRNDVDGYAKALGEFDARLGLLLHELGAGDVLILTADHGCDPATPSTDHSREYAPMLIYGERIQGGVDLGTRETFADIGKTVLDLLGVEGPIAGTSFLPQVER
ncbi:phosphopentomutase [Harryflintia acetispora]|uniref:Phosphopentomutase n=1 Tax=Harryflintia acetispora TaxID=1849041 RepID=A0A9X8UI44_9FIRM|nr:phosphopentomutase [Harryflintia acetispora]TCL41353.1 phosphopentomutase [Harryflintia acetispora]